MCSECCVAECGRREERGGPAFSGNAMVGVPPWFGLAGATVSRSRARIEREEGAAGAKVEPSGTVPVPTRATATGSLRSGWGLLCKQNRHVRTVPRDPFNGLINGLANIDTMSGRYHSSEDREFNFAPSPRIARGQKSVGSSHPAPESSPPCASHHRTPHLPQGTRPESHHNHNHNHSGRTHCAAHSVKCWPSPDCMHASNHAHRGLASFPSPDSDN